MILEHGICMIIMLVALERRKCERYWPDEKVCVNYNDEGVSVEQVGETTTIGAFIKRDFSVSSLRHDHSSNDKNGTSTRRLVEHWQYTDWPDHGAPRSPHGIVQFVRAMRPGMANGRAVVHCSAGCGRTGTFCTIWTAIEEMARTQQKCVTVDWLADVIAAFKHQRHEVYTVETPEQYDLILRALEL